jgi:2,5-diamino-6-(ribosylamino)-4(3H)-pyrimidinone 5'-phosphate reductase
MVRPRISTNLAISADGKISSDPPRPSGWTSSADYTRLLELRGNADALMVGRGTLESDCMTLTVPGKAVQPLRCIISRMGKLDPTHPIFRKEGGAIHLLATGNSEVLAPPQVTVHRRSLAEFLVDLGEKWQVGHLHCEGGGQLIYELAALDVIDEFHLTLAGHTLFGGQGAPTATGLSADFLPQSGRFALSHFQPLAGECFLSYTRLR